MFGHDWEKADGTIIDSREKHPGESGESTPFWEFVVDVRPLGQPHAEPMMRVQVHQPHLDEDFWPPDPGDTVHVEVHPDGKVRFDKHDPRLSYTARRKRMKDHFADELNQPPGT